LIRKRGKGKEGGRPMAEGNDCPSRKDRYKKQTTASTRTTNNEQVKETKTNYRGEEKV
jgi:hypothetical protein